MEQIIIGHSLHNFHFAAMASTIYFSLFTFLSLVSLPYSSSEPLFINCGSNYDIKLHDITFVRDANDSSSGNAAVENLKLASTPPTIYDTARVFTNKSWYELQAEDTNTFVMVRLHFLAFSTTKYNLSDSTFGVSVSGFSLLSNFSVGDTIQIKEFIIPIGGKKSYKIVFTPSNGSSLAFVNAIETFTTPSNLFTHGVRFPRISPAGNIGDLESLTSAYAFNPIYRINVGGQNEENDTLRRKWTLDDPFIFNTEPAINSTPFPAPIQYRNGGAEPHHAPAFVYKTAKQLKSNSLNITWNFGVNKNATYLVRAHFCDIISKSITNGAFIISIYSHFNKSIYPQRIVFMAIPFFKDWVVDSVESGFVNISINAIPGSNKEAFLNGIEIMELLKNSGVVDLVDQPNDTKNTVDQPNITRPTVDLVYQPNNTKNTADLVDQTNDTKNTNLIVYIVVPSLVFVLLILITVSFTISKFRKANLNQRSLAMLSYGGDSYTGLNMDPSTTPHLNLNLRIPFDHILKATNKFDENLMIAQGGFGKVYEGTLSNGRKVAVKRGKKGHSQGRPEFVTEIKVLSMIRHRYLVSLIGYCEEKSEMILVYEFMENGTLQDHLYGNKDHLKLSWEQRLEVCINTARGLHYLHTGSKDGIIHRDVKSTNILLNDLYVAKVADFGISRFDNVDESQISDIKGSFGYMDPEYMIYMKVTQKSDVYAFGVVLLEVLCARPALDPKIPRQDMNLAEWAMRHIKDGNVETIIDPFLADTINTDSLRIFLTLVERCLKESGEERPTMIQVQGDLEYALEFQQPVDNKEFYEDSNINTSLQFPMSVIHRLPSLINDDSEVNDGSSTIYPSESQVISQLRVEEAG